MDSSISFSEILKYKGHNSEYTISSPEALEMISKNNYDLIFLDINMPEISGLEMLDKITRIKKNQPNCIMVTGDSDPNTIISAMNAGAVGYLVKPIDFEKLDQLLTKTKESLQNQPTNVVSLDLSKLSSTEKKLFDIISNKSDNQIGLEFRDIDPHFPGLKTKAWIKVMNMLNELSEKGYIQRKERERVILCPYCDSLETYSRYLCPSCNSSKVDRLILIQHIKCGHTEHRNANLWESEFLCPKCSPTIHEPKEYKIIGTIYECSECGSRSNRPNINHYCKKCDKYFDYRNSRYVSIYYYSTNDFITENNDEIESKLSSLIDDTQSKPALVNDLE